MHPVGSGKMAAARERFEYSLRSASNDHYIERNGSSSTTLPTNNDIQCKVGNTSDYYSCKVYYILLGYDSAQNALPGTLGTLMSQIVTLCPRLVLYPLLPLYLVIMSVSPHYYYSARLLSLMQEVAS